MLLTALSCTLIFFVQIHKHGVNWESLHSFIHPEDLPEDYGGHMESLDAIEWESDIAQRESVFTLN